MADDLLINGTSLSALGRIVQDFGNALGGAPTVRNDADVIAGRFGSIETDSVTGSLIVPVKMLLLGKTGTTPAYTRGQYHDVAIGLRRLVFNRGRAFDLTRVIDAASGEVTHETRARYLRGLEDPQQVAAHGGKVAFDLEVFAGHWFDTADITPTIPGTVTAPGDAETRRMTITLPGAGTLANTTLGVSVTVTTACTLDVEEFTATAGIATIDWAGSDYWFEFAPGANIITWSGTGIPSLAVRGAHL